MLSQLRGSTSFCVGCCVQVGDVAVADGKIVAVGPDLGMEAAKVIDASGKHVMPGWTDIHTCAPALEPTIDMSPPAGTDPRVWSRHYDTQCMWDPQLLPSGPGGVTSASAPKPARLYLRAVGGARCSVSAHCGD